MSTLWKVVFAGIFLVVLITWEMARREAEITYSTPVVPSYQSEAAEQPLDFTLKTIQGQEVRLQDLKGHPILLNFWASWCQPCIEELPSLLSLAQQGGKNWDLKVLAVSEDENSKDIIRMFADNKWKRPDAGGYWAFNSVPMTILMDPGSAVASTYGTSKFPETFFINKEFKIKRKFIGSQNWTSQEMIKWFQENL